MTTLKMSEMELAERELVVKDVFSTAWKNVDGFKKSFWSAFLYGALLTLGYFIIITVISTVYFVIRSNLSSIPIEDLQLHPTMDLIIYRSILTFISGVFIAFLMIGLWYVGIRRIKNLPINAKMIFYGFTEGRFTQSLWLIILFQLITTFGNAILSFLEHSAKISYGIYAFSSGTLYLISLFFLMMIIFRLIFTISVYVDQKLNPIDCFKVSWRRTEGHVWKIVGISLLLVLVIVISAIPLGIGLIWSLPLYILVVAVMYDRLVGIKMSE